MGGEGVLKALASLTAPRTGLRPPGAPSKTTRAPMNCAALWMCSMRKCWREYVVIAALERAKSNTKRGDKMIAFALPS